MILALVSGASMAAEAQVDDCPIGFFCVVYNDPNTDNDPVIEIDPTLGPVQAVVVRERHDKVTDFGGTANSNTITMAIFVKSGEGFVYDRSYTILQDGRFAALSFGDALTLTEVIGGN